MHKVGHRAFIRAVQHDDYLILNEGINAGCASEEFDKEWLKKLNSEYLILFVLVLLPFSMQNALLCQFL